MSNVKLYVCPCGQKCEIPEITPELLEEAESVHDGWFEDSPRIDWDDFVDRMERHTDADFGCDMGSPAVRAIQRHIRAYRKL